MKNLTNMYARLEYNGGQKQQDRMINDKIKSLKRAEQYSYQGATVQLLNSTESVSALINPNKLLADYDEKVISVEYGHGFEPGQVFKWINSYNQEQSTYWIIYLQDLTELAYFRADVRRCSYQIKWYNSGKEYSTYVAIKGPKEQKIQSVSKSQFNMDVPSYTITILAPKNEETLKYFQRYTRFYLQGLSNGDTPICWRVEAIDSISLPGLLEIHAREYFANDDEDNIAEGIVGGLIDPIISEEQIMLENKEIVGDNFIKPRFTYTYEGIGEKAEWSYDTNLPISAVIKNDNMIEITWNASYSGQFNLYYGDKIKTIVVESLF